MDKARCKLAQLADEVRAANAPAVLMRRGEPLAVLVSPAEFAIDHLGGYGRRVGDRGDRRLETRPDVDAHP